ncbi:MAG TPA: CopD family protein, partial [Nitrososphaera sp.]|nr:CopD family protein [Nitrososphaera sp.]
MQEPYQRKKRELKYSQTFFYFRKAKNTMMIFSSSYFRSRSSLSLVAAVIATAVLLSTIILINQPIIPVAYGHAIPSTYSIEPNSILNKGSVPSELIISFSERPDPQISYIRVVNSENERIDNDDFTVSESNPRQAMVTLDTSKLEQDGVYTVSWRALSLDDGHIAQGSYVFGVGNVTPDSIVGDNQQQTQTQTVTYITSTADALLRWPLIVSQAAIVGGVMAYFVLQSGGRGGSFNLSRYHNQLSFDLSLFAKKRFALILIAGALAIAVSGTALIFLQASNLNTDSSSTSDQYLSTVRSLIFDSPSGVVWSIRIGTSAIIAALAFLYFVLSKRADVKRKISTAFLSSAILLAILAAGAASIFSNSMLSHNSAATFFPSVAVFADWVHFMAVSAWVGGLFYFSAVILLSIRSNEKKAGESAAYHLSIILPRFSLIATASLGIIGVTGLYMAWIHLHTLDSLFYTPYGNNLIIKLSAALPMVLLGAYHQVKLHKNIVLLASLGGSRKEEEHSPQQHSDTISNTTNNSVSKFGKTVKIESLIGIGVLFAAALLTITSPPTQMQQQQVQEEESTGGMNPGMEMQNTTTATPGFSEQATISGVDVTLEITPFHAGFNTFTITLSDAVTGSPPQNINAVYLRFTNPEARIGPIVTTLNSTSDGSSGKYSGIGGYLSQTGNWEIDLIVQRIGAYDLNHSFDATLETSSDHESMNMGADMNMHVEDHEASTATTTSANTNATEGELESPPAPPALDSFAWLAIGLSIAVGAASA